MGRTGSAEGEITSWGYGSKEGGLGALRYRK